MTLKVCCCSRLRTCTLLTQKKTLKIKKTFFKETLPSSKFYLRGFSGGGLSPCVCKYWLVGSTNKFLNDAMKSLNKLHAGYAVMCSFFWSPWAVEDAQSWSRQPECRKKSLNITLNINRHSHWFYKIVFCFHGCCSHWGTDSMSPLKNFVVTNLNNVCALFNWVGNVTWN